jgi:hypothetical protein
MKRNRWVRTEILPNLGMRVTYKYGTTTENASISLIYSKQGLTIGLAAYTSPSLERPLHKAVALTDSMKPEEANKEIWSALTELEKEGRDIAEKRR